MENENLNPKNIYAYVHPTDVKPSDDKEASKDLSAEEQAKIDWFASHNALTEVIRKLNQIIDDIGSIHDITTRIIPAEKDLNPTDKKFVVKYLVVMNVKNFLATIDVVCVKTDQIYARPEGYAKFYEIVYDELDNYDKCATGEERIRSIVDELNALIFTRIRQKHVSISTKFDFEFFKEFHSPTYAEWIKRQNELSVDLDPDACEGESVYTIGADNQFHKHSVQEDIRTLIYISSNEVNVHLSDTVKEFGPNSYLTDFLQKLYVYIDSFYDEYDMVTEYTMNRIIAKIFSDEYPYMDNETTVHTGKFIYENIFVNRLSAIMAMTNRRSEIPSWKSLCNLIVDSKKDTIKELMNQSDRDCFHDQMQEAADELKELAIKVLKGNKDCHPKTSLDYPREETAKFRYMVGRAINQLNIRISPTLLNELITKVSYEWDLGKPNTAKNAFEMFIIYISRYQPSDKICKFSRDAIKTFEQEMEKEIHKIISDGLNDAVTNMADNWFLDSYKAIESIAKSANEEKESMTIETLAKIILERVPEIKTFLADFGDEQLEFVLMSGLEKIWNNYTNAVDDKDDAVEEDEWDESVRPELLEEWHKVKERIQNFETGFDLVETTGNGNPYAVITRCPTGKLISAFINLPKDSALSNSVLKLLNKYILLILDDTYRTYMETIRTREGGTNEIGKEIRSIGIDTYYYFRNAVANAGITVFESILSCNHGYEERMIGHICPSTSKKEFEKLQTEYECWVQHTLIKAIDNIYHSFTVSPIGLKKAYTQIAVSYTASEYLLSVKEYNVAAIDYSDILEYGPRIVGEIGRYFHNLWEEDHSNLLKIVVDSIDWLDRSLHSYGIYVFKDIHIDVQQFVTKCVLQAADKGFINMSRDALEKRWDKILADLHSSIRDLRETNDKGNGMLALARECAFRYLMLKKKEDMSEAELVATVKRIPQLLKTMNETNMEIIDRRASESKQLDITRECAVECFESFKENCEARGVTWFSDMLGDEPDSDTYNYVIDGIGILASNKPAKEDISDLSTPEEKKKLDNPPQPEPKIIPERYKGMNMDDDSFWTSPMSCQEFRDHGFLILANSILHHFGVAISYNSEKDSMSPLRVKYRGFNPATLDKMYMGIAKWMKENGDEIYDETLI